MLDHPSQATLSAGIGDTLPSAPADGGGKMTVLRLFSRRSRLTPPSRWRVIPVALTLMVIGSLAQTVPAHAAGGHGDRKSAGGDRGRTESATTRRTTKTPFPATGYFSIGHKNGRYFFVTPTGQPFYSTGIDHVSSDPDTDQVTGQCPYCEAIQSEYPSTAAWATATVSQLR